MKSQLQVFYLNYVVVAGVTTAQIVARIAAGNTIQYTKIRLNSSFGTVVIGWASHAWPT